MYQFLDKKRAEGKPYFVYMTAAQNKFLRIYYARMKECLIMASVQESSESYSALESINCVVCKKFRFCRLGLLCPFYSIKIFSF